MEGTCGDLGFRELDQQGRVRRVERQALTPRLGVLMGLFGGIALICPVLIMVRYPSESTNLITVSVATILFASLLAIEAFGWHWEGRFSRDCSLHGCAGCIFRNKWELTV